MTETPRINFASDNAAPVTPEILAAIGRANAGPAMGYGNDPLTRGVEEKLKLLFDCDLKAFPVATGTAANSLGLSVMVPPYGSVFCHRLAHIEQDECGAPEFYSGGGKLALLDGEHGKLGAQDLDRAISNAGAGVVHHVQPAAISLTQASECGTVYTAPEISAISHVAKRHGLGLHMDGARFANAVAHLDCPPADITWRAGVDVLSFGATKNGAMAVEAVIFFNIEKAREFEFRRKRGAHLFSKMRSLSAQLDACLVHPVEAKIVFAKLPEVAMECLAVSNILYYPSGPKENREVRLVTSWNTTEKDIDVLMDVIR